MRHETVNKVRVVLAFGIALVLIAAYAPRYGPWIALLWLVVVIWQYRKKGVVTNGSILAWREYFSCTPA